MNTNAKHTAGPWRTANARELELHPNEQPDIVMGGIGFRLVPIDGCGMLTKQIKANAALIASAPTMLEALHYAAELIQTARKHFPKSVQHADRFDLENVCATIGKAIHQAEGGAQ